MRGGKREAGPHKVVILVVQDNGNFYFLGKLFLRNPVQNPQNRVFWT